MSVADLEPVPDEAALWVNGKTLVIADLHLGREVELEQRGFTMPPQGDAMGRRIEALLDSRSADRLVILGDLKHRVARSWGLERRDLPRLISRLSARVEEIHLVKGNHDSAIEYHIPRTIKMHHGSGFAIDRVGFAHGHTWPSREAMDVDNLVMGHNHPAVLIVDTRGYRTTQRCWVRIPGSGKKVPRYEATPREYVIMPAFNEFSGGTTFNEKGTRLLGPLLNSDLVDLRSAKVYLLDGTNLGRLKDIMVPGRGHSADG